MALLTGAGFCSQSMVADEIIVNVIQSSPLRMSAKDLYFPIFMAATILDIYSVIIFIFLVVGCPNILLRGFAAMIDSTVSCLDMSDKEVNFILLCFIYSY